MVSPDAWCGLLRSPFGGDVPIQILDVGDLRSDLSGGLNSWDELERVWVRNLLGSREQRLFVKDLEGRFLFVSEGWLAGEGAGRSLADVLGRTDAEIFGAAHATAALEDERRVIATGEPIIEKLERETFDRRLDVWVSTTRLPLRDRDGGDHRYVGDRSGCDRAGSRRGDDPAPCSGSGGDRRARSSRARWGAAAGAV